MNLFVEAIGIVSSVIILISICCKTNSYKSALILRLLNLIGSVTFVIYGALLPAFSVAFLNGVAIIVNLYHIIKLKKDYSC